jgi:hypothetical protein
MNFATSSELLRKQVAKQLEMQDAISPQQQRMIADRLISLEFDRNFYSGSLNSEFNKSQFNPSYLSRFASLTKGTFFTLYATISIWLKRKIENPKSPDCLVYALPEELVTSHASSSEVRDYLSLHLLDLGHSEPEIIYVQSRKKKIDSTEGMICVRDIGIALLPFCNLDKHAITKKIWKNYVTWLRISRRNSEILNIGAEFIIDSISFENYPAANIKSLITTQSVLLCPPIAFQYFPNAIKVMIWYSDNSQQIKIRGDKNALSHDYSYLDQQAIDVHLVWTESWARILREYSGKEVRAVGPILFKRFTELTPGKKAWEKNGKILVFDVTPKKFLGDTSNYYNDRNAREFIEDILEASNSIEPGLRIDLKPKREYSNSDSAIYLEFLKTHSSRLRILSSRLDLAELVQNYELVICIPFTSPAIISKRLGVETFFYNPSFAYEIGPTYEGIHVVTGRQSLVSYLHQFR